MENITVGMKLYMNITDYLRQSGLREVTVKKVGRKYFYTDYRDTHPIRLDNLKHEDANYSQGGYQLYRTAYEINDINERHKLAANIKKRFSGYDYTLKDITLDQLRQIATILNL